MKLGKKKRHSLGLFSYREDAMPYVLIEPEFYAILKESGCPTARRSDGSYCDDEAQELWKKFKDKS